jgi:hypothetical protein
LCLLVSLGLATSGGGNSGEAGGYAG